MDFIRVSNLRELQRSTHMSDVAIACGKRSSNGPDQNTPSRTRDESEGLENLSSKICYDRVICILDVKVDDVLADDVS